MDRLTEEKKDGYRVKKEGPIHFVFRGSEHIGNILAPQLGGDKKSASQYKAVAKHWGKQSSHPSKHAAMNWLKNSHGLTVRLESTEPMYITEITKDTSHIFKNEHGHEARVVTTHFSNGETEYSSHLPPQHKVVGLRAVRHSTFDKASKRLTGLGYKHNGKVINEAEEYKEKLASMDNSEMKEHFRRLYDAHVKNGMAPKHFKSPQHIAAMIEKQHKVPSGTYTRNVHEGEETYIQGTTPHSQMINRNKRQMVSVVKKDPNKAIDNQTYKKNDVIESFLRVYHEALEKLDPDTIEDDDRNEKPTKKLRRLSDGNGSEIIKLPKTETNQPGPTIELNPRMNKPVDSPDIGVNDQKKKPATT